MTDASDLQLGFKGNVGASSLIPPERDPLFRLTIHQTSPGTTLSQED